MNRPQWVSLFVPGDDRNALIAAVESALVSAGAVKYDPFGAMPGLSYPRAVRLFAAPQDGAWLRLIVSPDCVLEPVISAASQHVPVVLGFISSDLTPLLTFYRGGQLIDMAALAPYLNDPDGFAQVLLHPVPGASGVGGISKAVLPASVRAMSAGLPARQIERLMANMTGGIDKANRDGAQAALQSVDWESGAGAWIQTALAFLGITDAVEPDYATVSAAYRTAVRLKRNPKATLYPGDAEARDAVPNALDYAPVFYGWKA